MDKHKRWPNVQGALNGLNKPTSYLTQAGFERIYGVRLRPKSSSLLMRFAGVFVPDWQKFFTTWRHPFGAPTIYYPDGIQDPMFYPGVLDHELVHVQQQRPWWGPWWTALLAVLLPLPVLFSGRWFIERPAYLKDIRAGRRTVDEVIDVLWGSYGWCWPKPLMRSWFERQLDPQRRDTVEDITPVQRMR